MDNTTEFPELYQGPSLYVTEKIYLVICVVLGSLANLSIVLVFSQSKALRTPRNLCWLFVTLCNLNLNFHLGLYWSAAIAENNRICKIATFFYGTGSMALTGCLILATMDRYAALCWPLWYKKRVSNKLICCTASGIITCVVTVSSAPYWTFVEPLKCSNMRLGSYFTIIAGFLIPLCVACIVLQIRIYCMALSYLRRNPQSSRNVFVYRSNVSWNSRVQNALRTEDDTDLQQDSSANLRFPRSILSRPEVGAGITVVLGMLPFLIAMLPRGIVVVTQYACAKLNVECDSIAVVERVFSLMAYSYVIYGPVVYCTTCKEFQKAAKRFSRKITG